MATLLEFHKKLNNIFGFKQGKNPRRQKSKMAAFLDIKKTIKTLFERKNGRLLEKSKMAA